ncbi:helix-turn-helix transcriptional regulator [Sphingobacterium sp. SRCM116780]|uniref:helix-turn-helix transcriptional regulator n=1 Tax=Sphingobacterium sp. SRCM116780 TaxID=2907623 RepID=UPI001F1BBBF6|nr:helix-turn-helix transcriptional regulator [Sphingobacterium sp. SRCM116780]UIR57977.1 helix-turn-helix transcriptional regulator [Sphingobacterium sp. SRCM116780]
MDELFKIYTIGAEEVKNFNYSKNEIHQHNFEELIIGLAGQLEHFIDFKSRVFNAPFISFVTQGKTHRVKPMMTDGEARFWVIRFKSEFIPETTFQLYTQFHETATFEFKEYNCFHRLIRLCEMMENEMQQTVIDYGVIKQLLSTIFTMIESERKKQFPETNLQLKNQSTTFKNFLSILEENFRRPEGINYYAEKLFMSARNLNLICQSILQQSVSEIIETRKLIEAKNLLLTTTKTISEIGFDLGYSDKAYFTNVFKKKAGLTPSEFRNEMQQLISE